jgi:hypothetical protein
VCTTDEGWGYEGEHWWRWRLTSRKPWTCCECDQIIPAGEQHWFVYAKKSECGEWPESKLRVHDACEVLRDFVQDVVCGGHGYVPYYGLDEEISEAGEYLDQDYEAWEEAGMDPPNPLEEVWGEIIEHYKALAA